MVLEDSLLSPVPTREGTLRFLESLTGVTELPTEVINGVRSLHYSGDIDLGPEFDGLLAGLDEGSEEYVQMKAFSDIQRPWIGSRGGRRPRWRSCALSTSA